MEIGIGIGYPTLQRVILYSSHPFFTSHLILAVHLFLFPYPIAYNPVSKCYISLFKDDHPCLAINRETRTYLHPCIFFLWLAASSQGTITLCLLAMLHRDMAITQHGIRR